MHERSRVGMAAIGDKTRAIRSNRIGRVLKRATTETKEMMGGNRDGSM